MPLSKEFLDVWQTVKAGLRRDYSEATYNLWFDSLQMVALDDAGVTLSIPNNFKRDILIKKYTDILGERLQEVLGFPVNVTILSTEGPDGIRPPQPEKEKSPKAETGTEQKLSTDEYTFDNFVVGSSNKFAHAASVAVANNPACFSGASSVNSPYNPLFIYGPSGLGKTHLMYAIINQIKKTNPEAKILYMKGVDFTNQLIDSISRQTTAAFREKCREADVLLIDDIQFIAGKEATQEEFFHTFNSLYEANKQIVLTSDRPPRDIKTLEERLYTRFEWGLLADITPPDIELRMAIIKKKNQAFHVEMTPEVVSYLAENLKNNIRQLEGAIKKLAAMSFLNGRSISLDMAKSVVSDLIKGDEPPTVTVDKIFETVSRKTGIPVDQIKGKKHNKEIANARHICVYLIRNLTSYSLPQIGQLLDRDHTTILSSERKVQKMMKENTLFEMDINDYIRDIRS